MNADRLPQLQQQILNAATVQEYETDLAHLVEIFEMKVRSTATRRESQPAGSLADAFRELRDGNASGMQIRYRYAGQHWLDTLLPTGAGTRLTRICLGDQ